MKFTSFNPMVISNNSADVIKLFEELGFERTHQKDGIGEKGNVTDVRMKNDTGFHVDVVQSERVTKDLSTIRMNVDDYEEAYSLLEKHGFKNIQGVQNTDTGSSVATMMVSPTGFTICISKHIKK